MIYGVGTDICKIARIEEALARHGERFAAKVLGPDELAVYRERGAQHPKRALRYLATRFAAKEAFAKAIGTGVRPPMLLPAAQMLNEENGKPAIVCGGALADFMREKGLRAQLSISDEDEYAVAFVIVEQTA
ncbi:holo-ACP synthase [Massilia sp. erpn]|uniref:holo-ACP synthase n=1 Tax=Massilia sp. erpn TaxID=2738142 RepID=UPI0021026DBF|nr:holo-ACP synthase [Massilia sp. erpn]UTY58914.1 holo-ACP synthase [Massilia sp. erpn]